MQDQQASLDALAWPLARLDEAMVKLSRAAALPAQMAHPPEPLGDWEPTGNPDALDHWMRHAAERLDIDIEPADITVADFAAAVRRASPAILSVERQAQPQFLAIVKCRAKWVAVMAPDGRIRWRSLARLRDALCHAPSDTLGHELDAVLSQAGLSQTRRQQVNRTLTQERLAQQSIGTCWLLRTPQHAHWWHHLRQAHLLHHAGVLMSAHILFDFLLILSWWVVGRHALRDQAELNWLYPWTMLLLALIPLRVVAVRAQGYLTVGLSHLLKQRLLLGALRLEPDRLRHMGAGQFIGTLIESEAVEAFFLNGGFFLMVIAVIKLIFAIGIAATVGLVYFGALMGYLMVTALVIWLYFRRCHTWTHARIQMTHTLIERMVGHRTRLVQEPRAHWHDHEDREMAGYMQVSQDMDSSAAVLIASLLRLWLVVAFLAIVPVWIAPSASVPTLAVALGATLLAYQGLGGLTTGVTYLISALISWTSITPFLHAEPPPSRPPSSWRLPSDSSMAPEDESTMPLLTARHLHFQYPGHHEPVLQQCNLDIHPHDRILLEGPSGGGKSTLVRLLTGLQQPSSGTLMWHGFDNHGFHSDTWSRRIIAAPQFHENQIFTGSVLFNLLMGRQWPPQPEDVQEARAICRELGLGPLLDRMPGGIYQMVGETGWQLSHGERSRLYMARAFLQQPALVILDESFGVLDPDSLQTALACVQRRAPALMVIAHP
ncbi:ATP-binding cassette domain-containing protein [Candidatus Entotheonella palauensis]|uniref:ATP-binding cassette domain-containing protein n=1 Tax=Candidatus Entotheonella palauensis TaxID=93172 RepID=UPI000B7ED297|nr:ABC transporter ATP-binding protein [Candidatus Entotheonella palauensis]